MNKKLTSFVFILILLAGSQIVYAKDYLGGKLNFTFDKKIELEAIWAKDINIYSNFDLRLGGSYGIDGKSYGVAINSSFNYDLLKIGFLNPNLGYVIVGAGLIGGIQYFNWYIENRLNAPDEKVLSGIFGPRLYVNWCLNSKVIIYLKSEIAVAAIYNFVNGVFYTNNYERILFGVKWKISDKIILNFEAETVFNLFGSIPGIGITAGTEF